MVPDTILVTSNGDAATRRRWSREVCPTLPNLGFRIGEVELMKVLGVNGSGSTLWLAMVEDDGPVVTDPPSLSLGSGAEAGLALVDFKSEVTHVLTRLAPDLIVILDPDPSGTIAWKGILPRLSAEVMLILAARDVGIEIERATRAGARSKLGIHRSGSLQARAKEKFPEKVGVHWTGKRDIAALAAASRHPAGGSW